ncbi:hypothetical protein GCM10027445_66440 [Amycolatopsis endophytica]|uniref:Glutamine synthetase adenylyltransferase n=1 Tax=Amycolatopsis endophytica TaxID=860233 RepID=A0A853B4P5_9PSEU|nr:hypothetical protein [Amycolatopsis endophytica]NYI89777.1 glutamine synthetase adenylyltransferase [Amycolatopsis endophytica]
MLPEPTTIRAQWSARYPDPDTSAMEIAGLLKRVQGVAIESQLFAGLAEKQPVVEALTLLSEALDHAHVDIPR